MERRRKKVTEGTAHAKAWDRMGLWGTKCSLVEEWGREKGQIHTGQGWPARDRSPQIHPII